MRRSNVLKLCGEDFIAEIHQGMSEDERKAAICEGFRNRIKNMKGSEIIRYLSKCYINIPELTYHLDFTFPLTLDSDDTGVSDSEVDRRDVAGDGES